MTVAAQGRVNAASMVECYGWNVWLKVLGVKLVCLLWLSWVAVGEMGCKPIPGTIKVNTDLQCKKDEWAKAYATTNISFKANRLCCYISESSTHA